VKKPKHKLPATALANAMAAEGWTPHPIDQGQTAIHFDPGHTCDCSRATPRITMVSIDKVLITACELSIIHRPGATTLDKVRTSSNLVLTSLAAGYAVTDLRTPLHRQYIPAVLSRTIQAIEGHGNHSQSSPIDILCAKCKSRPAKGGSPIALCDSCTPKPHPKSIFRKHGKALT